MCFVVRDIGGTTARYGLVLKAMCGDEYPMRSAVRDIGGTIAQYGFVEYPMRDSSECIHGDPLCQDSFRLNLKAGEDYEIHRRV
jgi:hypothetical protein